MHLNIFFLKWFKNKYMEKKYAILEVSYYKYYKTSIVTSKRKE